MKRFTILSAAVAAVLLATGSVEAGGKPGGGSHGSHYSGNSFKPSSHFYHTSSSFYHNNYHTPYSSTRGFYSPSFYRGSYFNSSYCYPGWYNGGWNWGWGCYYNPFWCSYGFPCYPY
jgi:hypothetical protein